MLHETEPPRSGDGTEIYGLTWPGKAAARALAEAPARARFTALDGRPAHPDRNVVIEGDSLVALKVLARTHAAAFDLIYADPPYNSGTCADYRDDFRRSQASEDRAASGREASGARSSAGRRHSLWLDLMYPRLLLARELLDASGVVAISIDDHEAPRLRLLLDEVFGEECFVATVVWEKKYAPANDAKGFSAVHEYILIYASPGRSWGLLPRTERMDRPYRHDDGDGRGRYRASDLSVRTYRVDRDYPVVNPSTGRAHRPPKGRSWSVSREAMVRLIAQGRIYWGATGTSGPQLKRYLSDVRPGAVPTTLWGREAAGHTHGARAELRKLFGTTGVFETPKPVELMQRLLRVATGPESMVLDFFAGSGTTAHAVMRQNAVDGGRRGVVLVQNGERVDARRKPEIAADYPRIIDVTRERVRRSAAAISREFPGWAPPTFANLRLCDEPEGSLANVQDGELYQRKHIH
ncbi:site-specific DNA-methyltransferase [Curtobacterium sp. S6]|uniref:site-specific DNA-methyltransferase n=1 Tax=Curtobacterium sp. S6 TaxID=1479623 RepID=UPI00068DA5F6|nr:site-specific DNA-methyltransferase [Curtobacterium sp. S6]